MSRLIQQDDIFIHSPQIEKLYMYVFSSGVLHIHHQPTVFQTWVGPIEQWEYISSNPWDLFLSG